MLRKYLNIKSLLVGATLGLCISWSLDSHSETEYLTVCDSMEESRLKVALEECSGAVMYCAWGDEGLAAE